MSLSSSDDNYVRISGTVKRDAKAVDSGRGNMVLDFALQVPGHNGRLDIFDCRLTSNSMALEQIEGFVSEGEELQVIGRLEKRTTTEGQRVAGTWVDVRTTATIIMVEEVYMEED